MTGTDSTAITADEELFDRAELAEFTSQDVEAGKVIGVMLSALFVYTLVAMSIAGFCTWYLWTSDAARTAENETPAAVHDAAH